MSIKLRKANIQNKKDGEVNIVASGKQAVSKAWLSRYSKQVFYVTNEKGSDMNIRSFFTASFINLSS